MATAEGARLIVSSTGLVDSFTSSFTLHKPVRRRGLTHPQERKTSASMWSPRAVLPRVRDAALNLHTRVKAALRRRPWLHWAFVYSVGILFFLGYRLAGLNAYIRLFGSKRDSTFGIKFSGIVLGFCEDLACVNYLATVLWGYDSCVRFVNCDDTNDDDDISKKRRKRECALKSFKRVVRFLLYLIGFLVIAAPVVANNLVIRLRQLRFTMEYIEMYLNEKGAATTVEVSSYELHAAYTTVVVTAVVTVFFSVVGAVWIDLSLWFPLEFVVTWRNKKKNVVGHERMLEQDPDDEIAADNTRYNYIETEDSDFAELEMQITAEPVEICTPTPSKRMRLHKPLRVLTEVGALKLKNKFNRYWLQILLVAALLTLALVLFPFVLLEITQKGVSSVVAGVALNTSLSEVFRLLFKKELLPGLPNGHIASAAIYIDSTTEEYTLFKDDVLYRRTTGFKGDLAFDVQVDQADLPNVLVIVVESFRYHDSQYLVGEDNKYLFKDQNITITPNFDRWAKRGIAFRNLWSSWRTSRSLESILFGQLPYDSITTSGTSGGSATTELSGMPQLFKAKGYEPIFTTGCRTDYDQWSTFLPTHGFDEVLSMNEFKALAEADLGISPKDWALKEDGGQARAMSYWGVHDDVSFEVLGNILTNKTDEQKARVKNNEPKKPFFINHYTISSHATFYDRPEWYVNYTKPDFSALMKGEKYSKLMKQYFDMRYFQDMALGKFMDRMQKQGILNDTIVVIVGDHGQAPEFGLDTPEDRVVSIQRVAATMIAEGRLGKYTGMMFDDAAEQYDLLNTLADIVGLPKDGLVQTGVGRSLKRKIPFGQRVVWSNNPSRKMSVVRGHERLQYDRLSNALLLHDADKDHDMTKDLYPDLDGEKEVEWIELRNAGRKVNAYFKDRWKKECLLKTKC